MLSELPYEILQIIVNKLSSFDRMKLQKILNIYWITEYEDKLKHSLLTKILECQLYHMAGLRKHKNKDFGTSDLLSFDKTFKDNTFLITSTITPMKYKNKIVYHNSIHNNNPQKKQVYESYLKKYV